MNTKFKTYRDEGFSLVELLIVTAVLALLAAFFVPSIAKAGNYNTPGLPIYIDGTTNTIVNVAGSAIPANTVPTSATNYFNLSTTSGSQVDTNRWPAVCLSSPYGSPGRIQAFQDQYQSGGANAGIWTERWAGSVDGTHWMTNPCPIAIILTNNGTTVTGNLTNWDTGGVPFWALYSQENTNGTTYITNHWMNGTSKTFN